MPTMQSDLLVVQHPLHSMRNKAEGQNLPFLAATGHAAEIKLHRGTRGKEKVNGGTAMCFFSILYETPEDKPVVECSIQPDFFSDLNLDQIVSRIVDGSEEYQLEPFFYQPLTSISAIRYRQEVLQDLQSMELLEHMTAFS